MTDEHPTFKMSDDEMHYTARTRAGHLIVAAIEDDEPAMRRTINQLAADQDPRVTPATLAVMAGMVARMAHALAADDDHRAETLLEKAVSDEIDRNAPRGQA